MFEGYLPASIAQILKRSDKTIKRDIQEIRERNALVPNVDFAKQFVGALRQKSEMHQAYLMRLARSKEGPLEGCVQAEYNAWRIAKEEVELLQNLGYLPKRPQEVIGDFTHHHSNGSESCKELNDKLTAIEKAVRACGNIPEISLRRIEVLRVKVQKIEVAEEITQIKLSPEDSDDTTKTDSK